MRKNLPLDLDPEGFDSTTVSPLVRDAVKHFAPRGLTPALLHPLILEFCRLVTKNERTRTGESHRTALRRAAAQAMAITEAGLEMQIHVLYLLAREHEAKVAMIPWAA